MADFGTALDLRDDLPKGRWSFATGLKNLANAVYRRVTTARGSLPYALDYGRDLRDLLGDTPPDAGLRAEEQAYAREVEKDERIDSCTVTFTYKLATSTLTAAFLCETADGPFTLVVASDGVTVTILESP